MFDCDTCVSEEQIALWKELSCLHFVNREIGKFCKRTRKIFSGAITLQDGNKVMQPELHKRLRNLCVQMLGEMPALGDARHGYVFALSHTSLQRRLREAFRSGIPDALSLLARMMDVVIAHVHLSPDSLVHDEDLMTLKMLRDGLARLIPSR